MQPGSIELGPSFDYGPKTREKSADPVVGSSSATPTTAASPAAQVELQIVALTLSSATSAASSTRTDETTVRADAETSPASSSDAKRTSATSLELSARAQRLALIPAQIMSADEIAEARKEVKKAEEQLAEVRTGNNNQERSQQIDQMTQALRDDAQARVARSEVDTNGAPEQPSRDAARAASPIRSEVESDTSTSSSSATVSVADTPPPSKARPDQATLAHGRSPFESSSPGSTGQSLDIVVGQAPATG